MAAVSEAQAIFKQIDTNGDGALDMTELSTKLSDFGMSEEKIMSLFVAMDKDGNGVVDATEWEQGYAEYQAMLRMPSLQLEILEAIAAARADPAQCAAAIRERKKRYSGNQYQAPPGLHAPHCIAVFLLSWGAPLCVFSLDALYVSSLYVVSVVTVIRKRWGRCPSCQDDQGRRRCS